MVASLSKIMDAVDNVDVDIRKEDQEGLVVNKPRYVIHIKTTEKKLSAQERRLYNAMLYYAKIAIERLGIENPMGLQFIIENKMMFPFKIPLRLAKAITRETKRERLVGHLKNMHSVKVEYNVLKKDKKITPKMDVIEDEIKIINEERNIVDYNEVSEWGEDSLVISPKINFDKDIITYYLPFRVMQLLHQPSMYVNVNILTTSFFDTPYAIALYEYLLDIFKIKIHADKKYGNGQNNGLIDAGKIDRASLYAVLGISENGYKTFKDFKKRVLQPSIDKINDNELTEFIIEDVIYERGMGRGRTISEVKFILKERKNRKKAVFKNGKIEIVKEAIQELPHSSLLSLRKMLEEKSMDYSSFKRKLQQIPETIICNYVDGYHPDTVLRTTVSGMLELYDAKNDTAYEPDSKEAAKIKEWLFENPDRIGDVRKVNISDSLKYEFQGKYFIAAKREDQRFKTVYEILDVREQAEGVILVIKDLLDGHVIEDGMKEQGKDPKILKEILEGFSFGKNDLDRRLAFVQSENEKTKRLLREQEKSKVFNDHYEELKEEFSSWIEKKKGGNVYYKILAKNANESPEGRMEAFFVFFREREKAASKL